MGTRLYPKLSTESLLLFCGVPAEDLDVALSAYRAQRELEQVLARMPLPPSGEELDYTLHLALQCSPVAQARTFELFGFGRFDLSLVEDWPRSEPVPLDNPLAAELIASSSWGERHGGGFGPSPIPALKALGCEGLNWG